MRQPAEYFDDKEIVLVYIASSLRKALKLEALLTDNGVHYAVETDTYRSGLIFRTERAGAFFYVAAGEAESTAALMRRHRFRVARDDGPSNPPS